jgi:hypothetical protein
MINIKQGRLFQLSSTGSRDQLISADALADKFPGISSVRSPQFGNTYNYGLFNSAFIVNRQLFTHNQVPHVACDIESGSTYDSGDKKVLFRQHLAFWRTQEYDAVSTGNGVDPATPYNFSLIAFSTPQMKQQSAWSGKFVHTLSVVSRLFFSRYSRISDSEISQNTLSPDTLKTVLEGTTYAGDIYHRHPTVNRDRAPFFGKKTPIRTNNLGGFFTRWSSDELPTDTNTPPANWMFVDSLNDQVIAPSRDAWGYGNTSNAGLNSYGYVANIDAIDPDTNITMPYASLVVKQVPVFAELDSGEQTDFMTIPEPPTDEALSAGNNTTLPSSNIANCSVRSDLDFYQDRTLFEMKYPDGQTEVVYYHRIQQLRGCYTQLFDLTYANPDAAVHI